MSGFWLRAFLFARLFSERFGSRRHRWPGHEGASEQWYAELAGSGDE